MASGWQQKPVAPRVQMGCVHLGLLGAALTLHNHPAGHEWVCTCGATFVVVSDGPGGPRKFEKRRR